APNANDSGMSAVTSASSMTGADVCAPSASTSEISAVTSASSMTGADVCADKTNDSGISAVTSASSTGANGMLGPASVEGLVPPDNVSLLPEWSVFSATSNGYQARNVVVR